MGMAGTALPPVRARLGAALAANDRRADHLRATLSEDGDGNLVATPFIRQDSSMLRLMAQADALILRPPHAPALEAGAEVPVIRLDAFGL
jgi:molybdopterin molybdotransferase